jgi:glyoxylase-like metal-dependent hydrolase (beta-lactamase superfamily II)
MTPTMARGLWRRGDILLPAPVAWILQQIETFAMPEALVPLRRTAHLPGDRPARIEYRAGINVIPVRAPALPPADMTNCVVVGERELYVIDPGTTEHGERHLLVQQINELLAHGRRVAAILLTHSHIDHVASAEFLREAYGAPIWAHANTAAHVKFSVDRLLEDGDLILVEGDPDWRLRCLYTPGHDSGHLCFLEETTRTMICGDMIANGSTIIVSISHGGDMDDYLKSLDRLLTEDYNLMIPGHGMVFFEDPKRIVRYYIEHRLKREAKVKAALEAARAEGDVSVRGLLKRAYDDTPEALWPLAEHSLRAHMKRLGAPLPDAPAADISGGL